MTVKGWNHCQDLAPNDAAATVGCRRIVFHLSVAGLVVAMATAAAIPRWSFASPTLMPLAGQIGQRASASGGTCAHGSQTFTYTGATQSYTLPAGCTSITVTLKGGGGGGGHLYNGGGNATPGSNGDLVTANLTVTSGATLTVYVGRGGYVHSGTSWSGASGGWGHQTGSPGGASDRFICEELEDWEWAWGGSGGGGSSGIKAGTTLLAEARGGNGGKGGDGGYLCVATGGAGGAGGGSNSPALTTAGGGAVGGALDADGSNGAVTLSW